MQRNLIVVCKTPLIVFWYCVLGKSRTCNCGDLIAYCLSLMLFLLAVLVPYIVLTSSPLMVAPVQHWPLVVR